MAYRKPLFIFLALVASFLFSLHAMSTLARPIEEGDAAPKHLSTSLPVAADFESGIPTDFVGFTDEEIILESGTWVSLDLPLSDFINMTSTEHIAQMILSKGTIGPNTVYVDNVYFYHRATEPSEAAPTPNADASAVVSLFSNAYTNVPVGDWSTDWDMADVADIQVAGDDVKEYTFTNENTGLGFAGINFDNANALDGTNFTHLRMDLWTPDVTNLQIKLVDFGGDGWSNGGNDSEGVVNQTLSQGNWQTLNIPISDFTAAGLNEVGELSQIVLESTTAGMKLYLDNLYFYNANADVRSPASATLGVYSETHTDNSIAHTILSSSAQGWGSNPVAFDATSSAVTPADGSASLEVDWQSPLTTNWGGVVLDFAAATDVSSYTDLVLSVNTSQMAGFGDMHVKLEDSTGDSSGHIAYLSNHAGGATTSGDWTTYTIPLSAFPTPDHTMLKSIGLWSPVSGTAIGDQDLTGQIYFDNIHFTGGTGGGTEPTSAAPTPDADASAVVSLFSNAYTDVTVGDWSTGWDTADVVDIQVAGDDVKEYTFTDGGTGLGFAGINFDNANALDGTDFTHLRVDLWTPDVTNLQIKLVDFGGDGWSNGGNDSEGVVNQALSQGSWQTLDIPISDFTAAGLNEVGELSQIILESTTAGVKLYLDNLYFYNANADGGGFEDGLLTNGDFEDGTNSWIGNAANVIDDGGNNVNYANVTTAGNPWDVNLSQVVTLIPDTTYTLSFKAKGTAGRTILAGLGLNHDPWTNVNEMVTLSADWQTYSYEFTTAGFGDDNSRVLFDMGADTGEVYLDDVSLMEPNDENPTEPTEAAPTPTWDAGSVISLFSNAYTDLPGTVWSTDWDDVTLEDVQIAGNDTKKYSNLVFAGIEPASPIDASAMTHIHLDIWTPDDLSNGEEFRIKLVDWGADGAFGGGDDTEHELTFTGEILKVAFDNATYSVTEGYTATITAMLNMASTEAVTVSYSTSDGTATAGTDYTAVSGTLVFPANSTSQSFTVATTYDGETEGDETIILSLTDPISATIGANAQSTLTINDYDVDTACLSDQALIIDDFENGLPEGENADGIGIGFATWQDPGSPDVAISTTDSPPAAVPDAGTPNNVIQVDSDIASWGGFSHAFENEDVTEWVNQDWSTYGGFCFWLYGNNTDVDLFIDIMDNRNPDATPPNDGAERWTYGFKDDFTGWKLFTIPFDSFVHKNINNEAPYDGFGREEVHGWAFGSLESNGAQTHYLDRVAIYGTAADGGLKVQFASATPEVNEGETAIISVTLNAPFTNTVTVHYSSVESSATPDRDYVPISGSLTFPPGTTEQTISVETIDDSKYEVGDERVILSLSDPVSATLGFLRRTALTIIDNDPEDLDLLDDFEGFHHFETMGNVSLSITELMTDTPDALPGQGTYEQVLTVDYDTARGGDPGFTRMFVESQDWSGDEGISFWYNGTGNGDTMTVKVLDNQAATTADTDPSDWVMAWSDEFNETAGTPPNPNVWTHELGDGALNEIVGWGNNELQYYSDSTDNAAMDGEGNLVITVSEVDTDTTDLVCWYGACEYTSARLISWHKVEFEYGRIEARVKVPFGDGLWPAFWTLGTNIDEVGWPQTGEIDIMEFVGREPYEIFGTIHGPGYFGGNSFGGTHTFTETVYNDYHTFTIEWGPDEIDWYVDDIHYHNAVPSDVAPNEWVFNHPFFLLLNVAVGGNFGGAVGDDTTFPQTMHVDYVRVYQAADTAERFEATFTDDTAGWRQISIPFSAFTRSAEQPDGAPDDELGLTEMWGYAFELPAGSSGNFWLDQVRIEEELPNNVPVATDDNAETDEDTAIELDVVDNDSDLDNDTLTITDVSEPANGIATTDSATITYMPDENYNGDDSFTYTISDGNGGEATATVSVTINAVNDAPEATADAAETDEDTAVEIDVLDNDTDIEGDDLTITDVSEPANGTATTDGDTVTYMPDDDYSGDDNFTYTISDGNGGTDNATVTVTILASYGVELSDDMAQLGDVGSTVTYTLSVINTGNTTDMFDLDVTSTWTTTLSSDSVTLSADESTTVMAWVEVPADATAGITDTATIIATSNGDNSVTDTATLTTTAENDGVDDETEDGAPNDGDGNGDGTPDSQQGNVASLPNAGEGGYVTIAIPDNYELVGVEAMTTPMTLPEGVKEFPQELFGFVIEGLEDGESVEVTLYLHTEETDLDGYWKYHEDGDPQWVDVSDLATFGTAMVGDTTVMTVMLTLTDGGLGDADGEANGTIVDPGGPSVSEPTSVSLADLSQESTLVWQPVALLAALLLLMVGIGVTLQRRRQTA